MSSQSTLLGAKAIEELRKSSISKEALGRISEERKAKESEKKSQDGGAFITFKNDKERKVLLFPETECTDEDDNCTCGWKKVIVPLTEYDAATKSYRQVPNKTQIKYNLVCYDLTTYDPNNPPKVAIWRRSSCGQRPLGVSDI